MARTEPVPLATLREALERLLLVHLQQVARLIQRRPPTRKAELVALIERHLEKRENLEAVLATLTPAGRAAVAQAVHGGGQVSARAFIAAHGTMPKPDGWIPALFHGGWWMTADLSARLRPLIEPPPSPQLRGTQDPPSLAAPPGEDAIVPTERHTERPAAEDLAAVLRLCEAGRLRCGEATRRPSAATVKVVETALAHGDFYEEEAIAAFAWPLLVQAGGLAELAGGRLQLTARGRRALQAPAADSLKALWLRWIDRGGIDEFSRIDAIKGQQSLGGRNLTAVAPRRRAVAAALAQAPIGQWVDIDAFFLYMQTAGHDFEVVHDPWRLYLSDPQYGSFGYQGYGDWSVVQGRFVLCLLFEYAATLGLIDVVYGSAEGARDDYSSQWGSDEVAALSRYDGLCALRVNALGAYVLGRTATYTPSAPAADADRPQLRVLPNLDVVATGRRIPAADVLALERYGVVRSENVWTLRRNKLLAAIGQGEAPEQIERFLRQRTQPPLPDTVVALLNEVRERSGLLRNLGLALVVECQDANLALLLSHDRHLRGRCLHLGDRYLAINVAEEIPFRKAVQEVGYVLPPAPDDAKPAPRGAIKA